MAIHLFGLFGSASIGVYSLVTENLLIIPARVSLKKVQAVKESLKVRLVHTTIGGSVLIGALACANSNGMLLPHFVRDEELKEIKSAFKGNVTVMQTKKTAYGNIVLANDYGAIVDPRLRASDIKEISETLGVEAVSGEIAGLPYVGSLAVATNKGVIAHPLLKESERGLLKDIFEVPVDVGTINCGIPYVGTGLIGNRYTAVAGLLTTGPEMFIIGNALDVVKEDE